MVTLDPGSRFLSSLVHYRTYASTKTDGTKENKTEMFSRVEAMHLKKYPHLEKEIVESFDTVKEGLALPSMRSCQFAGIAIEREATRMYNCFSADTEFLTPTGLRSFSSCKEGEKVVVLADKHQWKTATVHCFGEQRLWKMTVNRGRTEEIIFVTEDHNWIKYRSTNKKDVREVVTTKELSVGDRLPTNRATIDLKSPCKIAIQHGLVFGDGTFIKQTGACLIDLWDDSTQFANLFSTGRVVRQGIKGGIINDRHVTISDLPYNWKQLPPLTANKDYLIGFLMGWFAADGSNSGTIVLCSSNRDHLEWARNACAILGIGTGKITIMREKSPFDGSTKPLYRISLFSECLFKEFFLKESHRNNFTEDQKKLYWKVKSIEPTNRTEQVWCVTEPETSSFTLGCGILTKNCSFLAITSFRAFAEVFFILCCGTGVGYSVQNVHVSQLPVVEAGKDGVHFRVPDSKEGWADSVYNLMLNPKLQFDYSLVRPEGSPLSTGGTASGAGPLQKVHEQIRFILQQAKGRKLTSVECSDIVCMIADCVVVGSVRRSATICLFDWDDPAMLNFKSGEWYIHSPWRGRANISAMVNRHDIRAKEAFNSVIDACFNSGCGEPGIYWTNDLLSNYGTNPCVEASLRDKEFCNLTSINAAACHNSETFIRAVKAATTIGTLQAGYDNIGYLQQAWKNNLQESRLLGVSMTGIAEAWDMLTPEFLRAGAETINSTNAEIAGKIGINTAARKGCIKPEGTSSAALGVSSGVHAHKDEYYWRRVRLDKNHPLAIYLQGVLPSQFIEPEQNKPQNVVVSVPIAKPGAITIKKENAIQLLEREKRLYKNWILPSHSWGENPHSVSITVDYKESEKEAVREWMWENRDCYSGIALFPEFTVAYPQLPFESMTKEQYEEIIKLFPQDIDLSDINYQEIEDERKNELACGGGGCEWTGQ
jgi:ribonucleoside-diphosphate reductase alpha chain